MRKPDYTDDKYVAETTAAINRALDAQQKLLDVWNSLNIGECSNLFRLIHDVNNSYKDAIKTDSDPYKDVLAVPIPNQLYIVAREAKKCIMVGHKNLWSIQGGETVVLNQDLADLLIHAHDIYLENDAQREFVENAIAKVKSDKYFTTTLPSMLTMQSGFDIPFDVTGAGYLWIKNIELNYVALREMIKQIK